MMMVNPLTCLTRSSPGPTIAERMGERLARLARSVSIRERRDFSCAVFDARGGLVANAPHIPVHLGAMGETVRDLLRYRGPRLASDPHIMATGTLGSRPSGPAAPVRRARWRSLTAPPPPTIWGSASSGASVAWRWRPRG